MGVFSYFYTPFWQDKSFFETCWPKIPSSEFNALIRSSTLLSDRATLKNSSGKNTLWNQLWNLHETNKTDQCHCCVTTLREFVFSVLSSQTYLNNSSFNLIIFLSSNSHFTSTQSLSSRMLLPKWYARSRPLTFLLTSSELLVEKCTLNVRVIIFTLHLGWKNLFVVLWGSSSFNGGFTADRTRELKTKYNIRHLIGSH